jgi:hypothetical protein
VHCSERKDEQGGLSVPSRQAQHSVQGARRAAAGRNGGREATQRSPSSTGAIKRLTLRNAACAARGAGIQSQLIGSYSSSGWVLEARPCNPPHVVASSGCFLRRAPRGTPVHARAGAIGLAADGDRGVVRHKLFRCPRTARPSDACTALRLGLAGVEGATVWPIILLSHRHQVASFTAHAHVPPTLGGQQHPINLSAAMSGDVERMIASACNM